MSDYTFGVGFHSSVALSGGRVWVAFRDWPTGTVQVWAWTDPAQPWLRHEFDAQHSPAFPRLHVFEDTLWLGYHDGTIGHLWNLTANRHLNLDPCQNNDPICFGGQWVAWQGAAADGWPITRMDLRSGEVVAAGMGQGTGLSRVMPDGRVITMDVDRFTLPGATCPSYATDIIVGEHGDAGVIWQLMSGERGRLWPTEPRFLPSVATDGDRIAITAWQPSAPVRVWIGTRAELIATKDQPPAPPNPPHPPDPPEVPVSNPLPAAVKATITQFVTRFPIPDIGDVPGTPAVIEAHEERCRQWMWKLAEQLVFSHPAEGFGVKRADPTRPYSKDNLPRVKAGVFEGWDLMGGAGTGHPTLNLEARSESLAGQHFEAVSGVNHLGGTQPPNPPDEPGDPDGAIEERLSELREELNRLTHQLAAVTGKADSALSEVARAHTRLDGVSSGVDEDLRKRFYTLVGKLRETKRTSRDFGHSHSIRVFEGDL